MYVSRLTLTDFRNYAQGDLELAPAPVVVTGDNGAGKTNLLEAVSLLAPGRGLRRAAVGDLANTAGAGEWAVSAQTEGPHGTTRIGTGSNDQSDIDGRPGARRVRIDQNEHRGTAVLGTFVRTLWITPAMDRLFQGPASDRRRFLDRLILAIDPEHVSRVARFEKAMRERNKLLAQPGFDDAWLDGVEVQMAQTGVAVAAARLDGVNVLSALTGSGRDFGQDAFPRALLAVDGEIENRLNHASAVEVEDDYRRILRDSRPRDRLAQRTLLGPHRSDLVVYHSLNNTTARQCSTGEQKALLISIVLAQTRLVQNSFEGYLPLLLLDEISAHLDADRRAALFGAVRSLGVQAWITGTDRKLFAEIEPNAQMITVEDGRITAARENI